MASTIARLCLVLVFSLTAPAWAAKEGPREGPRVWVAPDGNDLGTGGAAEPLATIRRALEISAPGTTILLRAGVYEENVRFTRGGAPGAPLTLKSADGPWQAAIRPANRGDRTVQGYGVGHIVLDGLRIQGGERDAVTFTMAGSDFTRLAHDITIRNCFIHDAGDDGIKIAQADRVQILDNRITRTGGQGIDFVAVNDSVIAGNDVSVTAANSLIMVKGGSARVRIIGNRAHDAATGRTTNGILIGGSTEKPYFRPGQTDQEAYDVSAEGNVIHGVGRGIEIMGAIGTVVRDTAVWDVPGPAVRLSASSAWHDPAQITRDTVLERLSVERRSWLSVGAGQGTGLRHAAVEISRSPWSMGGRSGGGSGG